MREMKVEWVFVQDLYPKNPVVDRECDPRITVPVIRLSEMETILREAVWAMELLQHHGNYKRVRDFLASPLVTDWQARQKETP